MTRDNLEGLFDREGDIRSLAKAKQFLGLSSSARFYTDGAGGGPGYTLENFKHDCSEQSLVNYFNFLRENESQLLGRMLDLSKRLTPEYSIIAAFGSSVHNSNGTENNSYEDIDVIFCNPDPKYLRGTSKVTPNYPKRPITHSLTMKIPALGDKKMDFGSPDEISGAEINIPTQYLDNFIKNFVPWLNISKTPKRDSIAIHCIEGKFQPKYQNLSLVLESPDADKTQFHLTFTSSFELAQGILNHSIKTAIEKYDEYKEDHPHNTIQRKEIFPAGVLLS